MKNKENTPTEKKLTPKETIFISEYLVDFNATQAAKKAGYSKKTAFIIGHEILKKPYIQAAIGKRVNEILSNNKELALKVVRECEKIAFGKISDVMDFDDESVTLKDSKKIDTSTIESVAFDTTIARPKGKGNDKSADDILTVKKRVKLYSKEKALEILAKYTALYTDAPQISLPINVDDALAAVMEKHGIDVES